jgi:cysteine sulfinate desulfinase/cysteine desulfurase-like protein
VTDAFLAAQAIETARAQVAALLGCAPDEIAVTSGGTKTNNAALTYVGVDATGMVYPDDIRGALRPHMALGSGCGGGMVRGLG